MSTNSTQTTKTAAAPASNRSSPLQSPALWLVGLVLLAAIAAIALAAGSNDSDSLSAGQASNRPVSQTAFAEIIGEPLPFFTSPDPAIGTEAPALSAQTLEGDRVSLRTDGTARLYGFFAHWCPHCQAELPNVAQWLEASDVPADVEVIAVSTAVDNTADNYPPSEWFARERWPNTVLVDSDDNALANGFGLTALPYWVAVDGDGNVVARMTGSVNDAELETLVNGLSKEN